MAGDSANRTLGRQSYFIRKAWVNGVFNIKLYYLIHNCCILGAVDLSFPTVCFQNFIDNYPKLASKNPKTKQEIPKLLAPLLRLQKDWQSSSLAPLEMAKRKPPIGNYVRNLLNSSSTRLWLGTLWSLNACLNLS